MKLCIRITLCSLTFAKSGGGFFPLHKFDKHHTAFLVIDKLVLLLNNLKTKTTGPCVLLLNNLKTKTTGPCVLLLNNLKTRTTGLQIL